MAGTRPMRPRPPPISPQARESHEAPSITSSSSKGSPVSKQPPTAPSPSSIPPNEAKSPYASVKKQKRYPPPNVPAPPPPYEGDTIKRMASIESPNTPNLPPFVAKEMPPSSVTKESGQGHPPPPLRLQTLEEMDGGSKITNKGNGAATVASRPRPPRPAPSRPSRPPAGMYEHSK